MILKKLTGGLHQENFRLWSIGRRSIKQIDTAKNTHGLRFMNLLGFDKMKNLLPDNL